MRMRTMPRAEAQIPTVTTAAERQMRWRLRNPELAAARVATSQAKKPELYRDLRRRANAAYRTRQRAHHAALVAAAAAVTALWASYDTQHWIDVDGFSAAVARLAALLPEGKA